MSLNSESRRRDSIQSMQAAYEQAKAAGDQAGMKPLEDLIRAWDEIQKLPPTDHNSFFVIAGYHGEPFRGAGWGNPAWWGGYCNHGNVLFPTWHRAYVLRIENALRSVKGCENVTLPFWDETATDSILNGVPSILTDEKFTFSTGETISNPLQSYTFQAGIYDNLSPFPDADYSKPVGYATVRYPLSGLVGAKDKASTDAHNAKYPDHAENVRLLNENVIDWLTSKIVVYVEDPKKAADPKDGDDLVPKTIYTHVAEKYIRCLDAPNYTVFSNTTSATQWNEDHFGVKSWTADPTSPDASRKAIVPLESPHNSIHLAVGGFELPGQGDFSAIDGANGDMGENDTASFDPIFFFHHCFIDRVFWLWQVKHGATQDFGIIEGYPGTNSVDSQGPTPGVAGGTWLTMDSPLEPFHQGGALEGPFLTSRDCVDIEKLGYCYGPCSLDHLAGPVKAMLAAETAEEPQPVPILRVSGINRAATPGSFLVSVAVPAKDKEGKPARDENGEPIKVVVATEAILSRWHVQGCANCQTHLDVKTFVPLHGLTLEEARNADIEILIQTRKGEPGESGTPKSLRLVGKPADGEATSPDEPPLPNLTRLGLRPLTALPVAARVATSQTAGVEASGMEAASEVRLLRSVRLEVR